MPPRADVCCSRGTALNRPSAAALTLRATASFGNDQRDGFSGAIDYLPVDARRSEGAARAAARLPSWASEQAILLAAADLPFPQRQYAAERVAAFEGGATPIAGLRLNSAWVALAEVFDFLVHQGPLHAPVKRDTFSEDRLLLTIARERHNGFLDNYLPGELEPLLPTLEGTDATRGEHLYRVPTDADPASFGFCALLSRYAAVRGYRIGGDILPRVEFAKYAGRPPNGRDSSGARSSQQPGSGCRRNSPSAKAHRGPPARGVPVCAPARLAHERSAAPGHTTRPTSSRRLPDLRSGVPM